MTSRMLLLLCVILAHTTLVASASAKVEVYNDTPDNFGGHMGGGDFNALLHAHISHSHKRRRHHRSIDPFHPAPSFLQHSTNKRKFVPPPPPSIERRVPKGREQAPPSAPTSFVLEVKPGQKKAHIKRVRMNKPHRDLLRHHMKRRRQQLRKFRRKLRNHRKNKKLPIHPPRLPLFDKARSFTPSEWAENDFDFNEAGDELEDD